MIIRSNLSPSHVPLQASSIAEAKLKVHVLRINVSVFMIERGEGWAKQERGEKKKEE